MEIITTEEVMDKLDMFKDVLAKNDEFVWSDLEGISSDAGMEFTSTAFQYECLTHGVCHKLAATEHQEMNGQIKVTWITLCMITHSPMVHARFLKAYIHFVLMCTAYHIFPVLSIKNLKNEEDELTTPFQLTTCTKSPMFHLYVLFCLYVVKKL